MSDITRKLASVRRIKEIRPHPNADLLDLAIVDGWQLVTAKENGFKEGDLVVYFEIDSFLPVTEQFEWLRKSSYRKMGDREGLRLRTIRLRGEISQGLIVPLSDVFVWDGESSTWLPKEGCIIVPEEGVDLTDYLGVIKWDPPLPAQLAGKARGNFPSFIPKTDQERVQNLAGKLDLESDDVYEVTLKMDGSSCTIYRNEIISVCSRNLDLQETDENSFWQAARQSGIIEFLQNFGMNIAIQAELMGPGIQGNRENLSKLSLFVFDIFDIDNQRYFDPTERSKLLKIMKENGVEIEHAPVIEYTTLNRFRDVNDFLEYANRPSLNHKIAEGVVFKKVDGDRFSFKAINNEFLLGEK